MDRFFAGWLVSRAESRVDEMAEKGSAIRIEPKVRPTSIARKDEFQRALFRRTKCVSALKLKGQFQFVLCHLIYDLILKIEIFEPFSSFSSNYLHLIDYLYAVENKKKKKFNYVTRLFFEYVI